jgi:hypothetical protein
MVAAVVAELVVVEVGRIVEAVLAGVVVVVDTLAEAVMVLPASAEEPEVVLVKDRGVNP